MSLLPLSTVLLRSLEGAGALLELREGKVLVDDEALASFRTVGLFRLRAAKRGLHSLLAFVKLNADLTLELGLEDGSDGGFGGHLCCCS